MPWPCTRGPSKEVAEADVSTAEATIAVLVALAVMRIPYYLPAMYFAISPERSGRRLRETSAWLLDHNRALEIVVGAGFGAVFLFKGIATI